MENDEIGGCGDSRSAGRHVTHVEEGGDAVGSGLEEAAARVRVWDQRNPRWTYIQ